MAAYNRIAVPTSPYTATRSISLVQQPMTIAKAELDSHADTCCLGENCLVIHDTEQLVSVEPFDKKLGSQQVKIVTAAVAYDCPATPGMYLSCSSIKHFTFLTYNSIYYAPTNLGTTKS